MERKRCDVSASLSPTRLAAAAVLSFTLVSCSWFTDFKRQPKIDPWETAADTIPFRGNPQGSVPIYGSVAPGFMYARTAMPQTITTMENIRNPIPADSASVNRGRIEFQINCAVCHGPLGMGNGTATKYGMPGIAIGAGSADATTRSDGYIFGMIRNGRGLMPTYNRIEESDRWDIVNYLRSIQGKGTIAADTSHGRPGETGALVPSASTMGPTRPSPYYHPAAGAAAAAPAIADTGKKTPTDTMPKKPEDLR
jgi:mono/diheme cytochrome c family protein